MHPPLAGRGAVAPDAGDSNRHEVRRRTADDLADCVRVLADVHSGDGYPLNWPSDPAGWLAGPTQLGAWVAECEGTITGHVALSSEGQDDGAPALWRAHRGTAAGGTAVVSRLFVSPAARGRRIGARLMAAAVQEAGERGLRPVLDVAASDTAAAALYERLGWTLLGLVERRWSPGSTVTLRCYAAPV